MVSALEQGLVDAIGQVRSLVRPPVTAVSLKIYPWHSYIAVSILDAATSPDLLETPADWHLFEAARSFDSGSGAVIVDQWGPVAARMNEMWLAATEVKVGAREATEHLHRLAAQALTSSAVRTAVAEAGWAHADLHVINVDDPDRRNYAGGH